MHRWWSLASVVEAGAQNQISNEKEAIETLEQYLKDAVLAGPEMRGSSPVRIDRDHQTMEIPAMPGVYPIGEGAGYAGGIVTAAVDGLRAAKKIVARYRCTEDA